MKIRSMINVEKILHGCAMLWVVIAITPLLWVSYNYVLRVNNGTNVINEGMEMLHSQHRDMYVKEELNPDLVPEFDKLHTLPRFIQ